MTWISKSMTAFGLLLLAHACYSAHEHSAFQAHRASSLAALTKSSPAAGAGGSTDGGAFASSLPVDVAIETVMATLVVVFGLVLNTAPMRPIRWRVWAGQIEREGEDAFKNGDGEVARDYIGNPFHLLETRPGFVDIRKQRKDFADWAKNQ